MQRPAKPSTPVRFRPPPPNARRVGTANLDRRSFLLNHEINAFILGTDFAQRLAEWSADLFSYWW